MDNGFPEYGFYAHLSSEFPSYIVVDVTDVCNLACIHCPHEELKLAGHFTGDCLEVDLNTKIVNEVAHDGAGVCQHIRYTAQGETLLHPDIIEMLSYAVEKTNASISITTNGTLLDSDKAEAVLSAGVALVDISIDAYSNETYEQIRRGGDLDAVRSNVIKLIELRDLHKSGASIVVSYIEQQKNMHETDLFQKFWQDAGVDFAIVRRLHSAGGVIKNIEADDEQRYPCLYPWERLVLGVNGQIHYCPQDWLHGSDIGDFRTVTIKGLWCSDVMSRLRQSHLNHDYCDFSLCEKCPDWSVTRWPGHGDSYSDLIKKVDDKRVVRERRREDE